MTQRISTPRRIVRAIHAGIAGVFLVMIPAAFAGDEDLRAAVFQLHWSELKYLAYWLILASVFLAVALFIRRANLFLLCAFLLLDLPMIKIFWDSTKGLLLAPVLGVSAICLLIEMSRQIVLRKGQTA